MLARRRLLILGAVALTAADLAVKAVHPIDGDPRSAGFVVLAVGIAAAIAVLVPRVPSRALACAGAVAAAGAMSNALSALLWSGGVPNPIVAGGIAFNVGDLYAVFGAAALIGGAVTFALRNPSLLRQPL